jgi:hypothetical protein
VGHLGGLGRCRLGGCVALVQAYLERVQLAGEFVEVACGLSILSILVGQTGWRLSTIVYPREVRRFRDGKIHACEF